MRALATALIFWAGAWVALGLATLGHTGMATAAFASGWLLAAMLVAAEREMGKAAQAHVKARKGDDR